MEQQCAARLAERQVAEFVEYTKLKPNFTLPIYRRAAPCFAAMRDSERRISGPVRDRHDSLQMRECPRRVAQEIYVAPFL